MFGLRTVDVDFQRLPVTEWVWDMFMQENPTNYWEHTVKLSPTKVKLIYQNSFVLVWARVFLWGADCASIDVQSQHNQNPAFTWSLYHQMFFLFRELLGIVLLPPTY